jgi:hypothetical protein
MMPYGPNLSATFRRRLLFAQLDFPIALCFRSTHRIRYSSEMPSAKTEMLALMGIRAAHGAPLSTIRNQRLMQAGHIQRRRQSSTLLQWSGSAEYSRSTPILRNLPDEHISQNAREQKNIENGLAPRFSHRAIAVANLSPMRRGVWYRSAQSFS